MLIVQREFHIQLEPGEKVVAAAQVYGSTGPAVIVITDRGTVYKVGDDGRGF